MTIRPLIYLTFGASLSLGLFSQSVKEASLQTEITSKIQPFRFLEKSEIVTWLNDLHHQYRDIEKQYLDNIDPSDPSALENAKLEFARANHSVRIEIQALKIYLKEWESAIVESKQPNQEKREQLLITAFEKAKNRISPSIQK